MDLQVFVRELEELGELRKVEGADWNLEMGTLTEMVNEKKGPALLFDRIKGYPPGYRVVTNLTSTPRRLAAAFGLPLEIRHVELVRSMKDKFKDLKPIDPVYVKDGPVLENVYGEGEIDLEKFPSPKWHEFDGGRYIGTGDMVITRDPVAGWVNAGTYRVEVHDSNTLALFISPGHHGRIIRESYWAQGKSCPVAVVFGAHPLVSMPSFLAFPWGMEEYRMAGGLLGQPLPLITGEYTGLPIPAYAEIAIEGECPPPQIESRKEGPFAEWTGYYASGERTEPVIKVKRIMHRNNFIIDGRPPLKPPCNSTCSYITRASDIWYELERLGLPGIKGVWNFRASGSHYFIIVSIEQKYAGHAKQVAMAAISGSEGAYHGRFVIVVDEDIDPSNEEDVLWAVATRCDPATSLEVVSGCWSTPLDPTIPPERKAKGDYTSSRGIILAVRPYHWRKEFPRVSRASNELRADAFKKWRHLLPLE